MIQRKWHLGKMRQRRWFSNLSRTAMDSMLCILVNQKKIAGLRHVVIYMMKQESTLIIMNMEMERIL